MEANSFPLGQFFLPSVDSLFRPFPIINNNQHFRVGDVGYYLPMNSTEFSKLCLFDLENSGYIAKLIAAFITQAEKQLVFS